LHAADFVGTNEFDCFLSKLLESHD
jgi:hypothetical protein